MIRWPWNKGNPDPEAFLAELSAVYPGKRYRNIDRYRDFRRVFLDSEQGMRVLYEILSWGHIFRSTATIANFEPYETMFHDGENNIALRIMSTLNAEPKERPTSTKETK